MKENPQTTRPPLFEPARLAQRRDRGSDAFANGADFLHVAVAESMAERLAAVTRSFTDSVLIGAGARMPGPIQPTQILELSATRAAARQATPVAALDPLPLETESADLVLSALELHWANDPVGQLIQMRRALRPDGLLIAALFAGQTLHELRTALAEAEAAVMGGLSPRVAPMAELRDLGALLQRAGFAMPVADSERVTVSYGDLGALMRDLRAMGETNILAERHRSFTPRRLFTAAEEIYRTAFGTEDGRLPATFEIVYLTGWAPAADQPVPLRPGSAKMRLADALGTTEQPAGDTTGLAKPPKL